MNLAKKLFGGNALLRTSLIAQRKNSYLRKIGWLDSFKAKVPINIEGEAIPWFTYSAISFLDKRVDNDLSIFEFGNGNSTLWWAGKVKSVISCEHDLSWFKKIESKVPKNVKIMHIDFERNGEYCRSILKYEKKFDLVVVDGRDRVNCAKHSVEALTHNGVIVWDNTNRTRYAEGCRFLLDDGFKKLDFDGMSPLNYHNSCTSVFYRQDNCLGI